MENVTMKAICTADFNRSCWERLTDEENKVYSDHMTPVIVMMFFFILIGIPGNMVVLVMYFSRSQRSTANIFIMFLAGIDLFACVVIHPYIVYKLYNYYDQTWTIACKIFEFLIHFNMVMSGLTLLLVAIDRYLAICKPVKFLKFDRHVYKGIVVITVLSVAVSMPLLEFYGPNPNRYEFEDCVFVGYRCDFQQQYQGSVFYTGFNAFMMTGFISEIVVMSILYKDVAVVAYRSRRAIFPLSNAHIFAGIKPSKSGSTMASSGTSGTSQALSKSSVISSTSSTQLPQAVVSMVNQIRLSGVPQVHARTRMDNSNTQNNSTVVSFSKEHGSALSQTRSTTRIFGTSRIDTTQPNQNGSRLRNTLKAAKLLFFVTFVFFLSWMPFFILRVCYTISPSACRMDSFLGKVIDNIINHVFYINNGINPILYTIMNGTFRKEFILMAKKKCQRRNRVT